MNPSQLAAVNSDAVSILVIAGAGSGKTTTLIERIKRLIGQGIAPSGLICITFTNEAAKELKRRLPAGAELGFCGTLHGYMLQLIQTHHKLLKLAPKLTVLDQEQSATLLAQSVSELRFKGSMKSVEAEISQGPFRAPGGGAPGQACIVAMHYHQKMRMGGLIDFDTILHYGARLAAILREVPAAPLGTHLFVDEFQDSGALDYEIYRALPIPNKFFVGDPDQCQPGETIVETDSGPRPIRDLRNGDTIKAYDRKSGKITGGHKIKVARRDYSGEMLSVSSNDYVTKCTPNHKWLVRWTNRKSKVCITYLMWRKDLGYRVGWCQLFSHCDNGSSNSLHFFLRCRLEKADKGWILGVHETRSDASATESIISTRFQIPTLCFEPVNGATHITKEIIERVFLENVNDCKPLECLNEYGRYLSCPLYFRNPKRTRTTFLEINACNLIPELHSIPNKACEWNPVNVTRNKTVCDVYSLDVEKHHSYVADGLVTLNCIYAFRGAKIDNILTARETGLVEEVLTLQENYRCDANICLVANTLIRRNSRRFEKQTISCTGKLGNVHLSRFDSVAAEMAWIGGEAALAAQEGTVAVLVRTNALKKQFRDYFEGLGLCSRAPADPQDWQDLKNFLALLATPSSDALAGMVMDKLLGREKSAIARQEAAMAIRPHSSALNLERIKLAELDDALFLHGFSQPSVNRLANIRDALPKAAGFPEISLALAAWDLRESAANGDSVTVATAHGSKGLEWDTVFLPAFENNMFPKLVAGSSDAAAALEEERRLAYVAITRARHWLRVSYCGQRMNAWTRQMSAAGASQFIQEAGIYVSEN